MRNPNTTGFDDSIRALRGEQERTENLVINLGSDDLPRYAFFNLKDKLNLSFSVLIFSLVVRFPCHSHKLDNAIKRAIASHSLANMMRSITRANAHFRRSVRLSDVFKEKKCRQRCESATRWSWVYTYFLGFLMIKIHIDFVFLRFI